MARILYMQFWCTDPDSDGITAEYTDIHLHPQLYIHIINRCYIYNLFIY